MIPLSLKQLRYFATAAEMGNVSKAADKLHISQPSISTAISAMESFYGQPLLVRLPGAGVSTTPFGRELLVKVRELLQIAEDLAVVSDDIHASVAGSVVIGCLSDLAALLLPSAIGQLKQDFPKIQPELVVDDFSGLAAGLGSGELDLVLSYEMALDETIIKQRLKKVRPYALLPIDHALAGKSSIHLRDLLAEPLIMTDEPYSREHLLQLFSRNNLTPKVAFWARSFELLRGLVANNHGVSVVYTQTNDDRTYDGEQVICRPLADDIEGDYIVLARCNNFGLTRPAKVAWSVLEESATKLLDNF